MRIFSGSDGHDNPRPGRQVFYSVGFALILAAAGCSEKQVRVYEAPVEEQPKADDVLSYTVPEGWREMPGSGPTSAAFALPTESGTRLEASFRKFNDMSGSEGFVLNMIRGEAQLSEITDENDVREQMETIRIADSYGLAFDVVSREPVAMFQGKMRSMVAMLHRGGVTWFFKYTGSEPESRSSEKAFRDWLAALEFDSTPQSRAPFMTSGGNSVDNAPPAQGLPEWTVPESWTPAQSGSMVLARFDLEAAGGTASLTVTRFPGDVGGLVPNVNRWRGQVGLPPVTEAEIDSTMDTVEVDGNEARLIDLSSAAEGQKAGLIAVWDYRQDGDRAMSWFYKLQGDFAAVTESREAFMEFVASIRYQ